MTYCFDERVFGTDDSKDGKDNFNALSFLEECRVRFPLQTVYDDLQDYSKHLQDQLVAIINRDYADFLKLSSKLGGVDEMVKEIRSPLQQLKKQVQKVQQTIMVLLSFLREQEKSKKALKEQEKDLRICLHVTSQIDKMERILDCKVEEDEVNPIHSADESDDYDNFQAVMLENSIRNNGDDSSCANLERVVRILIDLESDLMIGAQLPHIQHELTRVSRIEQVLYERLETEFSTEIAPDVFYDRNHLNKGLNPQNKLRLQSLFRCYRLLEKKGNGMKIPSQLISSLIMEPYLLEHFSTPSKTLESLYKIVLDYIQLHLSPILFFLCEQDCQDSEDCVTVLTEGILKPLVDTLYQHHPNIFKPAHDPHLFHQNYLASMHFLTQVSRFSSTDEKKQTIIQHSLCKQPVYLNFLKKWNLPVYFKLRSKELWSELLSCSLVKLEIKASCYFNMTQILLQNLAIWNNEQENGSAIIVELTVSYVKLTLEMIRYYQIKLNSILTTESVEEEEKEQVYALCHDLQLVLKNVTQSVQPQMAICLIKKNNGAALDNGAIESSLSQLLQEPLKDIEEMEMKCWQIAAASIAQNCKKILPAVRTIKNQYQMTNKPPPNTYSPFVSNILKPLTEFLVEWGKDVFKATSPRYNDWLRMILNDICESYYTLSMDFLHSAIELEESLKSRQKVSHKKIMVSTEEGGDMSDTQKMKKQLLLDVEQFQKNTKELGFDVTSIEFYLKLVNEVSS